MEFSDVIKRKYIKYSLIRYSLFRKSQKLINDESTKLKSSGAETQTTLRVTTGMPKSSAHFYSTVQIAASGIF